MRGLQQTRPYLPSRQIGSDEIYPGQAETGLKMIYFGVYECQRCKKSYTVMDEWVECSPEFCHACLAFLKSQYALLPDPEPMQ
mgnify:CR=1 FL=1